MSLSPVAPTEQLELRFNDIEVSILRIPDLAPHVDCDALLGAGEVIEPPYWMHLWPAAMALSRLLVERDLAGPDARMFELGCGLGLPSLVGAHCGARVVASDWQWDPLVLLRRSAALNGVDVGTVQMDWRTVAMKGVFDLVVGADVAYDAAEEDALVVALAACVREGGRIVMADSVNTYREGFVGKLEAAGFRVRRSQREEQEDGRSVWVRCLEGEAT